MRNDRNRRASPIALADSSSAKVRDICAQKNLGSFSGSYSAIVPALDAFLLIVRGSEGNLAKYGADGAQSGGSTEWKIVSNSSDHLILERGSERIDILKPEDPTAGQLFQKMIPPGILTDIGVELQMKSKKAS